MTNELVRAVCPCCRGRLDFGAEQIVCASCNAPFDYRDGFADLIVGGRFDDQLGDAQTRYEEQSNEWLADRYLVPTLTRMLAGVTRPRVLSLGCGTGVDIDRPSGRGVNIAIASASPTACTCPSKATASTRCIAAACSLMSASTVIPIA